MRSATMRGRVTRSRPAGTERALSSSANAWSIWSRPPRTRCRKRAPCSVRLTRRVVRCSSRTPIRASSARTFCDSAEVDTPRASAARVKLACSATWTKATTAVSGTEASIVKAAFKVSPVTRSLFT